jgi:integral membrane sensor domain MASE1
VCYVINSHEPPLIGACLVALAIGKGDYWVGWRISFFSEAIVYLTLMPAILGWFGKGPTQDKESRTNYLEAAVLIAGLVASGYFAFAAPRRYGSEAMLYALVQSSPPLRSTQASLPNRWLIRPVELCA